MDFHSLAAAVLMMLFLRSIMDPVNGRMRPRHDVSPPKPQLPKAPTLLFDRDPQRSRSLDYSTPFPGSTQPCVRKCSGMRRSSGIELFQTHFDVQGHEYNDWKNQSNLAFSKNASGRGSMVWILPSKRWLAELFLSMPARNDGKAVGFCPIFHRQDDGEENTDLASILWHLIYANDAAEPSLSA